MTAALCVCCERPMPDHAYACVGCSSKAAGQLRAIIDLAPDARLVAAGLVRRGRGGDGGKPGSQSPLNDGATDALGEVQNTLTTLARDIAETRGLVLPDALGRDPIVVASRWLLGQVEWLRHAAEDGQPWAPGSYAEISDCAGRMRGIVNGPSEQRFLGPCGSTTSERPAEDGCPVNCACHNGPHYACDEPGGCGSAGCGRTVIVETDPCQGDVYCHLDAEFGRCKTCGAKWPTAKRRAWLDGEVRSHAFRASEVHDAYGISADTIRSWARRGKLRSYFRTEAGIVADWADPPEGEIRERLYYVGDVLDLAAADAARRAEEQAKRARRAAAREAATSEGDAA